TKKSKRSHRTEECGGWLWDNIDSSQTIVILICCNCVATGQNRTGMVLNSHSHRAWGSIQRQVEREWSRRICREDNISFKNKQLSGCSQIGPISNKQISCLSEETAAIWSGRRCREFKHSRNTCPRSEWPI